jgi:Arc/MetJ-type ribon-helix-helix transcriptional regulator
MKEITIRVPDDMAALIEQWAERIPEMELVKVDESALLSNGSMAERIRYAIVELRTERLLRRKFDYAWLKVAMDSTDDLPSFESAQRYLDYLCDELRLDGLPCESSISKMMDTARGPLFNWTFSDTNDEIETTRRNNIVKRFFNLMRGRK